MPEPKHELTVEEAFETLEGLYGHPLNEAKRKEIGKNLADFFAILHEWDQNPPVQEAPTDVPNS